MKFQGKWIKSQEDFGDVAPTFVKEFSLPPNVGEATLTLTAFGVYEAILNGQRVGEYIFAPGWTSSKRLQYQSYDITSLLQEKNILSVTVGKGWYRSPLSGWFEESDTRRIKRAQPSGFAAVITVDGNQIVETNNRWQVHESPVRFSELYDGEFYDANISNYPLLPVEEYPGPNCSIAPQQGDIICEVDRLKSSKLITTPKGEIVVDFGQNLTGYVELSLPPCTKAGEEVVISFAEVLDTEGNFYTDNYRSAKSKLRYICRNGAQTYKPKFTFFGFRYIRLDKYPAACSVNSITAISVHSDMKRTGWLASSNPLLNQLFENIVWGQKGNFLDIPTDCPQRDERLGWTGDAQTFVKAASYNYDTERFFTKWLTDLALEQHGNGCVTHVIPDAMDGQGGSAAWADAATICPWQIYLTYGNKEILENQFESMRKWVDYITAHTTDANLWIGGTHFGDWLSLEPPPEEEPDRLQGSTRADFIASAFYANSTQLVIKAGKVLGLDVLAYESLYEGIVKAFRKKFTSYLSQTEHILALQFELASNPQAVADALAKKIASDNFSLQTGFVGTPYMLHVLTKYGHTELAYTLLLREEYPSWLYPITKGATTVWERWDSIKPNGDLQTANMNSFNHYAYGAVADWVYSVAAGIQTIEEYPGFARVRIAPMPDLRLGWLSGRVETRHGIVISKWQYTGKNIRYDIVTPSPAEIIIDGKTHGVDKGSHVFFGDI